jgi:hypothetical protein
MTKLGLRYPPANSVDRDSHAARVMLLAEDCADIPDDWLDVAAARWAKAEPFFPRTCELRDAALSYGRTLEARLALPSPPVRAAPKPLMDRRGEPMSEEETAEVNRILELQGAKARYRPDGSRYFIDGRTDAQA